jgi:hypothetical protein
VEILKGPHLFEFGDHGGALLMAPASQSIDHVLYGFTKRFVLIIY